jgi:hypothetical protein
MGRLPHGWHLRDRCHLHGRAQTSHTSSYMLSLCTSTSSIMPTMAISWRATITRRLSTLWRWYSLENFSTVHCRLLRRRLRCRCCSHSVHRRHLARIANLPSHSPRNTSSESSTKLAPPPLRHCIHTYRAKRRHADPAQHHHSL